MNEFELIRRYFDRTVAGAHCVLGIGDDAAVLRPRSDEDLAVCSDTLIAGRHFPHGTRAADIGYKALAVNLSDLAAMGARPLGFLLNLSLPEADEVFLQGFAAGLFELADAHGVALLGGDTTRGPLSISITAWGALPRGECLRRAGAQVGDLIVCGGNVGGAALALRQGDAATPDLRACLDRPQPQLALGQGLLARAHAAIDVSDGLAADLGHILDASGVGGVIDQDALPLHPALAMLDREDALALALAGGDDYVLCFTIAEARWDEIKTAFPEISAPIGRIIEKPGLYVGGADGKLDPLTISGFRHF